MLQHENKRNEEKISFVTGDSIVCLLMFSLRNVNRHLQHSHQSRDLRDSHLSLNDTDHN